MPVRKVGKNRWKVGNKKGTFKTKRKAEVVNRAIHARKGKGK